MTTPSEDMKNILDILSEERVLNIKSDIGSKEAIFTEACDDYFSCSLTKEQVLKLAKEIESIGLIMQ